MRIWSNGADILRIRGKSQRTSHGPDQGGDFNPLAETKNDYRYPQLPRPSILLPRVYKKLQFYCCRDDKLPKEGIVPLEH